MKIDWAGVIGSIVILLHTDNILKVFVLALLVLIFSWARHKKYIKDYILILGLATYCMVVVTAHPTLQMTLYRSLEIFIGILISMLVSRFIFPVSVEMILQITLNKQWGMLLAYAENILIYKKTRTKQDGVILIEEEQILGNYQKIQSLLNLGSHLKSKSKSKSKSKHKKLVYKNYIRQNSVQLGIYRYLTSIDCKNFTFNSGNIDLYKKEKKIILKTLSDIVDTEMHVSKLDSCEVKCLKIKQEDIFKSIKDPNEAIEKHAVTRILVLLQEVIELMIKADKLYSIA